MTAPVKVTQVDRDAAKAFVLAIFDQDNDANETAARAVQAFARHRIAAETASAARVAELEALIADAYYVLTYVEASVGDDVTRAACKSVRDGIDAHTTPDADDAGGV